MAGVATAGKKVPLESVPAAAVTKIKDQFPKAEISSVDKESNGDFEFVMKEGKRRFDVGVTPQGKLVNVKEELPADQVPEMVLKGLLKKFPGATIVEAEKVITGEGKAAKVTYELVIKKTDNVQKDVEFDAHGKLAGDKE